MALQRRNAPSLSRSRTSTRRDGRVRAAWAVPLGQGALNKTCARSLPLSREWPVERGLWLRCPSHAPFQGDGDQLLGFDGEFHRQFLKDLLDETVDQKL